MLIIFDLIPEAYETFQAKNIGYIALFSLVGLLVLKFLDHFIPDHEEEHHTKEEKEENLQHIGVMSCIALVVHNFIEGMAVYSTCLSSATSGLLVSLGVGLHNIPLGMVIASTLANHSKKKGKKVGFLLLLSLSTCFGGAVLYFLPSFVVNDFILGALLSITVGMLFYISFLELLPRIRKGGNPKEKWFGILLGIVLLSITFLI